MDQITRFYRIMYGSMDSLFVNRREAPSLSGGQSLLAERPRAYSHNLSPSSSSESGSFSGNGQNSKVLTIDHQRHLYPSTPNLKSLVLDSHSEVEEEFVDADEDDNVCFSAAAKQSRPRNNSAIEIGMVDENECNLQNGNLPPIGINGSSNADSHNHSIETQQRPMSKSCQNLTRFVKNPTAAHRKLKNNGGGHKPRDRSSTTTGVRDLSHGNKNGFVGDHNNNNIIDPNHNLNKSKKIEITSTKELIEVLIYNLQIAERHEKEIQAVNANMEKANAQLTERLSIARQEMKLLEQKCSHLRQQMWRCILCSRDKIELYSAEIRIAALECGHCYCTSCCQQFQDCHSCIQYCQICKEKFIVERIVHL